MFVRKFVEKLASFRLHLRHWVVRATERVVLNLTCRPWTACASASGPVFSPGRYRLAGMKKHLAALLALWALLFAAAGTAMAAPQRASLPDIENEVMCPTCGVALSQSFSPQAERERDFIRAE